MHKEFQERVKQERISLVPVKNLSKASKNTSRLYDPSFTQSTDIKDQAGTIIIKAGTKVNP